MSLKTKPKDTKHLQLRFKTWWLYYRIPKHLKSHPKFINGPAIFAQSLGTDSLKTAKRLRDGIIYNLNAGIDDPFTAWQQELIARTEQFRADNPHLEDGDIGYQDLLIDSILNSAINQHGADPETGHPIKLDEDQQDLLDVINNRLPAKHRRLRFITTKLLDEYTANKKAPKTVLKIRRAADWFLGHIIQDDIDIESIDYDQVRGFLTQDLNAGVSGSTINGHLYGLKQIWDRAKSSKLVTGENPFSKHRVTKDSQSYDPYTQDEIAAMYAAAEDDLKTLIHAAATTGARINELLTAEVKTCRTTKQDRQCWLFKFQSKGKTEQSTRAVPLHPTLQLPEGFRFNMSDRTVTRRFRDLKDRTLGEPLDPLTGKPRKLSFHSFRTTVITELTVNQRINEKVVGAVTGHLAGSARTGSIRTYINPDDLESKYLTVSEIPWKIPHRGHLAGNDSSL
jgi:integrase